MWRKIPVILFMCACTILLSCSNNENADGENVSAKQNQEGTSVINFESEVNDLGRIVEGEQLIAWFDFTNTGKAPLVIQKVEAGCGCTIPEWNKEPVLPGEKGSIKVIFSSRGKRGVQKIKVTVHSNAENNVFTLYLTGEVINKN